MNCKYEQYEIAKRTDIYNIQNDLRSLECKYDIDRSMKNYVYFYHFVSAFFLMLTYFSLINFHAKLNDLKESKVEVEVKK